MNLNHPEATQQALDIVRSGDPFQWYVITLAVIVLYIYGHEYERGNYKAIAAGLSLYMVHWFVEIVNALIQHFSGHALWTVPDRTAFSIMVGVGIEISLMFSIAGIVTTKLLPKDPKAKIAGINSRIFVAVFTAAAAAIIEIFLVRTPAFVWVYPFWGSFPVFVTVYIPFFAAAVYAYDAPLKRSFTFVGALGAVNLAGLVVFGLLGWI
ncbi:MAG: hypothetical protein ACOX3E_12090 [Desulfomonilia bacterium]|jgi:hypothetical protein|uniref:Uncharacterized protein n=1 Tax=anaerobic digester metagenome TaxID=1263854 RepID=A0A485LX37_9ZZZZ|nr:hypothetical protein [Pseudomonadota bacterium]HON38859.1 hypothetical protein [Deltaproteobacteria bacterium]HRS56830.1 hypothetical protein [Desulfomonilia bacterium]HPD21995.1 hypothetical protein [Deltaproteobacteria bacterium]HPW69826.1 hypothetical protein [Deltaproteobacteria bacterium]